MINPYDRVGKIVTIGKITIELCAMPRRMDRKPPRGEPYYPFKLGYRFKDWNPYTTIQDVYHFIVWQLLFEKHVRFLNEHGELCDTKKNSHWESAHLAPLQKLIDNADNLTVDAARLLGL